MKNDKLEIIKYPSVIPNPALAGEESLLNDKIEITNDKKILINVGQLNFATFAVK